MSLLVPTTYLSHFLLNLKTQRQNEDLIFFYHERRRKNGHHKIQWKIQVRKTPICFCKKCSIQIASVTLHLAISPWSPPCSDSSNHIQPHTLGDTIKVGGFISLLFFWHGLILLPPRRCRLQRRLLGEQGKDKLLVVQQWFIAWCIYRAREKPGAVRPAAWRVLHSTLALWLVRRRQRAIHAG